MSYLGCETVQRVTTAWANSRGVTPCMAARGHTAEAHYTHTAREKEQEVPLWNAYTDTILYLISQARAGRSTAHSLGGIDIAMCVCGGGGCMCVFCIAARISSFCSRWDQRGLCLSESRSTDPQKVLCCINRCHRLSPPMPPLCHTSRLRLLTPGYVSF